MGVTRESCGRMAEKIIEIEGETFVARLISLSSREMVLFFSESIILFSSIAMEHLLLSIFKVFCAIK